MARGSFGVSAHWCAAAEVAPLGRMIYYRVILGLETLNPALSAASCGGQRRVRTPRRQGCGARTPRDDVHVVHDDALHWIPRAQVARIAHHG